MAQVLSGKKLEVSISNLIGPSLDYAFALSLFIDVQIIDGKVFKKGDSGAFDQLYNPSTNWMISGPFMDNYNVDFCRLGADGAGGEVIESTANCFTSYNSYIATGPTRLSSTCRAIIGLMGRYSMLIPVELQPDSQT